MSQQRVVIVKPGLLTVSTAHFAGGKHVVQCISRTLARNGLDVHVVLASTRANVLVHAESRGLLRDIHIQQDGATISWQQEQVTYHAALEPEGAPAHERASATWQRLLELVGNLTAGGTSPLLVDADDSQAALGGGDSCLFAELAYHFHQNMSVLVQNVHFLPFGPSGSSPRTPLLLHSWTAVRNVFCVSRFVADYLRQWSNIDPSRLHIVHLSAFDVYGAGPFPNHGLEVAQKLEQGGLPPAVGMLKLTPEKGSAIFFELCRRLSGWEFLAVAADPEAWLQAAMRGLTNLRLSEPQEHIDTLLQQMAVVVAPSIWLEAWGMVAVEAMLRGIPVVASDAGGLPEACLGAGTVLPVNNIQIPVDQATGCPDWKQRSYPRQEMEPWVEAVQHLLGSSAAYLEASHRSREAAQAHLQEGPGQLVGFLQHLLQTA